MFVNVRVRQKCSLKRKAMMVDGDVHDQIERLESDIEHLAESLERCRKAMLFLKVAGAISFEPAPTIRRSCGYHWRCRRFWLELEHSEANHRCHESRRDAPSVDRHDRSLGGGREPGMEASEALITVP